MIVFNHFFLSLRTLFSYVTSDVYPTAAPYLFSSHFSKWPLELRSWLFLEISCPEHFCLIRKLYNFTQILSFTNGIIFPSTNYFSLLLICFLKFLHALLQLLAVLFHWLLFLVMPYPTGCLYMCIHTTQYSLCRIVMTLSLTQVWHVEISKGKGLNDRVE